MYNSEIVKITNIYNSNILNKHIKELKNKYNFLNIEKIGQSVLKKDILCISFGKGNEEIFFSAAIHANEWITTMILMNFIEWLSFNFSQKKYNLGEIFFNKKIYFVPMVNPDGVDLLNNGLTQTQISNMYKISKNYLDIPFPNGWKANYNGIDLNLQFPANWEQARNIKFSQGFTKAGPRDFVGNAPLTQPEAQALYTFTLNHNLERVITYHTQGKVIYYKYLDIIPKNTLEIAQKMQKESSYVLEDTPYNSSFAGYKDWFIQEYNRPGFTIEAGIGQSPLSIKQFNEIYKDNFGIIMAGIKG